MTVCWIISEKGLVGTESQCLGVADALGVAPVIKQITLHQPWKALSPWLGLECASSFAGDPLAAPWPDLVIAAGRKAVAAARYIKRQNPRTFTVFLQDPRINPRHFDLVAVPGHDRLRGNNVVVTQATPNRITPALLEGARETFRSRLEILQAPRVAVLIGGSSRAYDLTQDVMEKLSGQLHVLAENGFSLMVTASRRTGEQNRKILERRLTGHRSIYFWDGSSDNPYHGFLAWADYIIVTADSSSMISEAATTGKPVYMVALEGGSIRFDRLHARLLAEGIIRSFKGKLEPYRYTALSDAAMVAAEIRQRMGTS